MCLLFVCSSAHLLVLMVIRMANIQTHAEAAQRIQKMIVGNKVDIEERAVSDRTPLRAWVTLGVVFCYLIVFGGARRLFRREAVVSRGVEGRVRSPLQE